MGLFVAGTDDIRVGQCMHAAVAADPAYSNPPDVVLGEVGTAVEDNCHWDETSGSSHRIALKILL